MPTRLELRFETSEGNNRTLSINNPILDLDPANVESAMNTITEQEMFEQDGAALYSAVKGARYVTRLVDDLFDKEAAEPA